MTINQNQLDEGRLLHIVAQHFVVVVLLVDGKVVMAPPIVKWMKGWSEGKVKRYSKSRGWEVTEL